MGNLKLYLVLLGAAEMLLVGALHCWRLTHRRWGLLPIAIGIVVLVGGWRVWYKEEAANVWELHPDQRLLLRQELNLRAPAQRFPVTFYPINGNNLSNLYAYQLSEVFQERGWRIWIVSPNYVVPTRAFKVSIAKCPETQGSPAHADDLRDMLDKAGIRYNKEESTEEDLRRFDCGIGLIVGQPPPVEER